MLDEMKEKFEDSFTDEEKIQIFNLIFSGYYSLSYIRFLAQKKAGRDLGLDVKEPQNLLPPEGEGADYDEYLDAILQQPNRSSILENPNKPEIESKSSDSEEKNNDVQIETPTVEVPEEEEVSTVSNEEVQDSISDSPISSSPLQESMLSSDLPGAMGPDSSLGSENDEGKDNTPEGFEPTRVDDEAVNDVVAQDNLSEGEDIKEEAVEEKEPLSPTIENDENSEQEETKEDKKDESDVITFGFGDSQAGEAHAPTVEVIQEDMRPKKEEAASEIKFVAPSEVQNQEENQTSEQPSTGPQELSTETVVVPSADTSVVTPPTPDTTTANPNPTPEVPTITLDQLQNPQVQQSPTQ